MRRPLAVLMTLLFLHISLGNRDLACANHEVDSATTSAHLAAAHGPHHSEGQHAPDSQPAHHHHGDLASGQPCCAAMASCSLSVVTTSPLFATYDIAHQARPIARASIALTRVTAPETPPPRA